MYSIRKEIPLHIASATVLRRIRSLLRLMHAGHYIVHLGAASK